jgi:DNA-binding response OmpR family regulator
MSKRILVVEDDAGIAKVLCDNLVIDGFVTEWASHGDEALAKCRSFLPDLVLLDVNLPGRSGWDLCRAMRQGGQRPVIIVSVQNRRTDKIRGFDLGADDYVTKPFDMEELIARIGAVLRRSARRVERVRLGDVTIDFQRLRAAGPRGELHLTHREFEILRLLAAHADQTVHRDRLLTEVWGVLDPSTTRSVDFAIVRLRKKLEEDPSNPRFIRTVRGDGYCLVTDG